jgi:amino acid transporter
VAVRNSIGPELGGAIGIVFYLAYCVGGTFYCMGFAETTRSVFSDEVSIFRNDADVLPWNPPGSWVTVALASAANLACLAVCMLGLSVSVRVSAGILVVIYGCIATSCVCLLASTNDEQDGATSFSLATFHNNTGPAFTHGNSLISVFAVFFPGFTGCLAGANLSGDLRDANASIAFGTIMALLSAFVVYLTIIFILAATVGRHTLQTNLLIMDTISTNTLGGVPIVFIGICFCTLSSALSYMLGAPRVLQALGNDEVFGPLKWSVRVTL